MLIRKMAGAACTAVAALALTGAGATSAAPASMEGGRAVAPTGTPPTTSGPTTTSADAVAAGCWYSASHWWCNNVSGAPVYASGTSTVVGYMYSNPSWFICRSDNGGYVGGPHPYRWEWTQADNGNWGWMKDSWISSETDPLPVC